MFAKSPFPIPVLPQSQEEAGRNKPPMSATAAARRAASKPTTLHSGCGAQMETLRGHPALPREQSHPNGTGILQQHKSSFKGKTKKERKKLTISLRVKMKLLHCHQLRAAAKHVQLSCAQVLSTNHSSSITAGKAKRRSVCVPWRAGGSTQGSNGNPLHPMPVPSGRPQRCPHDADGAHCHLFGNQGHFFAHLLILQQGGQAARSTTSQLAHDCSSPLASYCRELRFGSCFFF